MPGVKKNAMLRVTTSGAWFAACFGERKWIRAADPLVAALLAIQRRIALVIAAKKHREKMRLERKRLYTRSSRSCRTKNNNVNSDGRAWEGGRQDRRDQVRRSVWIKMCREQRLEELGALAERATDNP